MSETLAQLTVFFSAIGCLPLAVYVCMAFYKYMTAAEIFRTPVPMVLPLAVLFKGPEMVLRQFHVSKSVAFGFKAVSTLALLIISVIGLRMTIGLFRMMIGGLSQLFGSTPRNPPLS
jgi:hypothetical protein